jgi:hypothetical protein
MARATAAIGCRSHAGWAVLVAVSGTLGAPLVLERRRVELLDGSVPAQPYHAAAEAGLDLVEAAKLIRQVEELATTRAAAALAETAASIGARGSTVDGVGVVAKIRSLPADLERILRAHALLHAAEGDLYEEALTEGALRAGLPVQRVTPTSISLEPKLDAAGRALGPPWQKDHKLAASAALWVLSTSGPSNR